MVCANLEGSSLRSCNFEDPAGQKANMEGMDILYFFHNEMVHQTSQKIFTQVIKDFFFNSEHFIYFSTVKKLLGVLKYFVVQKVLKFFFVNFKTVCFSLE